MKRLALLAALSLAACHGAPEQANSVAQSQAITLPEEPSAESIGLPEIVASHCTACHSPEMIAYQPPMPAEKWAATVKKMREAYKAPIAESDDKALVDALVAFQASRSAPPPAPGK